ncbi:hypothetical protein SD80_012160 [Scytonema tolypothrichoides VB-61278]|nr:hypothetical protein SD80_012160 [Scytonema tolypothrichoides VB-61278]
MVSASPTRPPRRVGPPLVLTLAALSAGAIAVQVFLAGLNVFLGPRWWGWHIAFGHGVGVLLLVQAAATWLTRMPARSRWLSLGMVALFCLQYNARTLASLLDAPYLIPLHAVNALALFWIATTLAGWARQAGRETQPSDG